MRPLKESDFDKGFLQLLSQLTVVGNVSRLDFSRKFIKSNLKSYRMLSSLVHFLGKFAEMKAKGDYFVTVIEDTRKQLIIGAGRFGLMLLICYIEIMFNLSFLATLVIEHKFIHDCGLVSSYLKNYRKF